MNMSKSRDIQAKMHLNDKNTLCEFLSFKCILARNCEGTEQLLFFKKLSVFVFCLKDREFFLSYCGIILLYSHRNVPQQVSSQIQAWLPSMCT